VNTHSTSSEVTSVAKLLNIHGVRDLTGLSRSTIERLVKADVFPKPVRVTAARLGWPEDEVLAFNRDRIAARDEHRDRKADPVVKATAGKRAGSRLAA
jgi:prophage regulatory protein